MSKYVVVFIGFDNGIFDSVGSVSGPMSQQAAIEYAAAAMEEEKRVMLEDVEEDDDIDATIDISSNGMTGHLETGGDVITSFAVMLIDHP